ncbi:hypothetical protein CYMTET_3006 [Cymbomonas tetramitiformis]|uniref:DNA polymerase n=1 Tax=Cymbomonas tetramitiformis TaxID=36881 RepID=A0AAE0H3Y7_9CHLO|nr:hypothetical protein CYMTET_3006 [Cymbomonas tetramitiformis]|eukprot:gene249-443_t
MADCVRVLPFRVEAKRRWDTRNIRKGTKRSLDESRCSGAEQEALVLWAIRAGDNKRLRLIIPVDGLFMYRAVCAFKGSPDDEEWLKCQIDRFSRNIKRIDDMRVTDSECMKSCRGFEIRADRVEELSRILWQIKDSVRFRTVRRDERAECGVDTFARDRNLRPFSWWTIVCEEMRETCDGAHSDVTYELRDSSGKYFEQNDLCLPFEIPKLLRSYALQVYPHAPDSSEKIRAVVIAPVHQGEPEENSFYGEATNEEEMVDLLRNAIRFLRETKIEILTGPDPENHLIRLLQRAQCSTMPSETSINSNSVPILAYLRLGRLSRNDIRAYAESMDVQRREYSEHLTPLDRFRADSNLLLRVLRQRRVVFMELFVHSVARKPVHDACTLCIREHEMDGVLPYVRHAYHDAGERMNPPQFVLPKQTSLEGQSQLPGGYNLPPSVGVHVQGMQVFDFQSFYPSCICSYNLGAGLVRDRHTSTPEIVKRWVPMVPLHIGDTGSDSCECCRRRSAFNPERSRVLREVRLGGRSMRIWQNGEDDEDTTYVCPIAEARSVASELLHTLITCRAQMRRLKDGCGEMACKVLANSVFGVFGHFGTPNKRNDLYDAACYKTIVQLGRTNLLRAVVALDSESYSIVYGDTDSLFVGKADAAFRDVSAEKVARSVTLTLRELERRPDLLDESNGASHAVVLRAVEEFSGACIFAKKRYIAAIAKNGRELKLCGFRKAPTFSERCDRAFTEFCAGLVLEESRHAGGPLEVLATITDFLVNFSGKRGVTTSWFIFSDCKQEEETTLVDAASTMWAVINRRLSDRSFWGVLFGDADWRESRRIVQSMLINHFQDAAPITTCGGRSELLLNASTDKKAACLRCKHEEHTRPGTSMSDPEQRETVMQKVLSCEDRRCESWHVESRDW